MTSNLPRPEIDFLKGIMQDWTTIQGIVTEGHRVAGQPSKVYPYSTLEKQKPYFKEHGLDLDIYFTGTLNISIAPWRYKMISPEFTFLDVAWTDLHPPEHFSFSRCKIEFKGHRFKGLVYYPHPETQIRNRQNLAVLEVMTEYIPGISYGDPVQLSLKKDEILIVR